MKRYLPRTWVSPKLISQKSTIHGDGVFAKDGIAGGEKLMEFGGELISKEQAESGNYRSRSIWIVYPKHYLALPNSDTAKSLDEHLNHSCNANAWLADEVTLVARRDWRIPDVQKKYRGHFHPMIQQMIDGMMTITV
ncbi:MAG: SET domain-containing protein [Candidatus Sungbacteria bacterium]|nr:SET domain-containing protein [Candidatus Sungbacteria bacterium]